MKKNRKVLIVSNMFPNEEFPFYGIFVKRFCDQLDLLEVEYDLSIINKKNNKFIKLYSYINFVIRTFIRILNNDYTHIYIHYASFSSIPVLMASVFKKLNIYTNVHGSDVVPEKKIHFKINYFTKYVLDKSSKIITPSTYFKEYIHQKYNIDRKIIYVYPSAGVDPNIFYKYDKYKRNNLRKEYGIFSEDILIGYVGRLSNGKGWDTFLKAVEEFKDIKNIKIIIVGDGEEAKVCNEYIDKFPNGKVLRLGLQPQEKLSDVYNMLDILVFPTEREGESLGLVALEAMACGATVISSDYAAPKYYIKDGYNGFKFEKGNFCDLTKKIKLYLELSEEQKKKIINNALESVRYYYPENNLSVLSKIFE